MRCTLVILILFAVFPPVLSAIEPIQNERTVRQFHLHDFEDGIGTPARNDQVEIYNDVGWVWQPMFDGLSQSSVLINMAAAQLFPPAAPLDHLILTVDNPQLTHETFSMVGRWAAVNFSDEMKVPLSKCNLKLIAEYPNLPLQTATVALTQIGETSTPFQMFKLSMNCPSGRRPNRLRLAVGSFPNVQLVIEDVRLMEPGTSALDVTKLPAAGEPPHGYVENALVGSALDIDPWLNRRNQYAPLVAESTNSGEGVSFHRRPADGTPRRVSLLSFDAPPVTTDDFGFAATISYGGLDDIGDFDGTAYFEMTACFPDGTTRVVGTTAEYGVAGRITGHSGARPMELAVHSTMRPTRLQLQLVSDGIGQITFQGLCAVQFEPPAPPATITAPPSPAHLADTRAVKSAGWTMVILSVLFTIVVLQFSNEALIRGGLIVMLILSESLFAWAMFLLGHGETFAAVAPLFAGALAWLLPLLAHRFALSRQHTRELRKMLTLDAA